MSNTFQKRIEELEAREKALIAENRLLKQEVDAAHKSFEVMKQTYAEYKQGIEETKKLKERYNDALAEVCKMKKQYKEQFEALMDDFRKTTKKMV